MLDTFNFPTPQTANYQEFYVTSSGNLATTWVKPRGASMVRFLLIGAGGGGGAGTSTAGGGGGGSGAVTSWIGPAMFVPDILNVVVGNSRPTAGAFASAIYYIASNGNNLLIEASGGSPGAASITAGAGGTAFTANQFTACGIFNSVAGQNGAAGSSTAGGGQITPSSTTFLSGGGGGSGGAAGLGGSVEPSYGYTSLAGTAGGGTVAGRNGYFVTQPILVGCGGAGGSTSTSVGSNGGAGGIGCGGGGGGEDNTGPAYSRRGGDGAVFIWAW
jgi:hypothetical protein